MWGNDEEELTKLRITREGRNYSWLYVWIIAVYNIHTWVPVWIVWKVVLVVIDIIERMMWISLCEVELMARWPMIFDRTPLAVCRKVEIRPEAQMTLHCFSNSHDPLRCVDVNRKNASSWRLSICNLKIFECWLQNCTKGRIELGVRITFYFVFHYQFQEFVEASDQMHNIKLALIKCIMNMFQEKGQWQIIRNGMAWKWLAIYSYICCKKRVAGIHRKRCVLLKKLKLLARLPVFCQRLLSFLDPS